MQRWKSLRRRRQIAGVLCQDATLATNTQKKRHHYSGPPRTPLTSRSGTAQSREPTRGCNQIRQCVNGTSIRGEWTVNNNIRVRGRGRMCFSLYRNMVCSREMAWENGIVGTGPSLKCRLHNTLHVKIGVRVVPYLFLGLGFPRC